MRKKILITLATAFLILAGTASGWAETFKIDSTHSRVGFSIRHIFSQVEGQFNDVNGSISYDADHPEKAWVKVEIKTSSIDTHNEKRDNHLRSPDFFDAEKFPVLQFESTKVVVKDDSLLVTGILSMHGVKKKINFPVRVLGVGDHPMMGVPVAGFSAETSLKRSDYGIDSWTDGASILGDKVAIRLNVEALGSGGGGGAANPCNPCGGENPCNPWGGKNPCNPCGG